MSSPTQSLWFYVCYYIIIFVVISYLLIDFTNLKYTDSLKSVYYRCKKYHQYRFKKDVPILFRKEAQMWTEGDQMRRSQGRNFNNLPKHQYGIYSMKWKDVVSKSPFTSHKLRKASDTLSRILHKVDTMKIEDQKEDKKTLGGSLNNVCMQLLYLLNISQRIIYSQRYKSL